MLVELRKQAVDSPVLIGWTITHKEDDMQNKHVPSAILAAALAICALFALVLGSGSMAQAQPVGVSPLPQTVLADQEPVVLDGVGLEAATSVSATVPVTAYLGGPVSVQAAVSPRNGPLPLEWEVGGPAFGVWSEEGGYSTSATLYPSQEGLQTVFVTVTQGATILRTSRQIQIIGPSSVRLDAPTDIEVGNPITLTATLLGWQGDVRVQWTLSVSETFFDVYPGTVSTTLVVTPTTIGSLRIYAEGCVFDTCKEQETYVRVRPPALTVRWQTTRAIGAMWGDVITATLSRSPVAGEHPKIKVAGNPESDLPSNWVAFTDITLSFPVWYDNTDFKCGRAISFTITAAQDVQIVEPNVLRLDTPGIAGVGGTCKIFLPQVFVSSPVQAPTPTPTPTNTSIPATATATPNPAAPTATPTSTPTRVLVPVPNGYQKWVNAGGGNVLDDGGVFWLGDKPLVGNPDPGQWGFIGGVADCVVVPITGAGRREQELYRCARFWANGEAVPGYSFTVPNGWHRVTLKFAELHFACCGQRKFNIMINGTTVAWNFDILDAAGDRFRVVDRSFDVYVTNGQLDIGFVGQLLPGEPAYSRDQPSLNAISIVQMQPR